MFANADSPYFVMLYYFYAAPKILSFVLPIGILIGSALTGISFAVSNEWTSAQALGFSSRKFCTPFLLGGLIWAGLSAVLSETVAPDAARKSHEVRRLRFEKKTSAKRSTVQRWFRGPMGIAQIGRYDTVNKQVVGLQFELLNAEFKPIEIITAKTALALDGNKWLLRGVQRTQLGKPTQTKDSLPRLEAHLPFVESQLVTDRKRESEYSIGELSSIIAQRENAGAEVLKPKFEVHSKIALLFFTLLLPLTGLRFAFLSERSSSYIGPVSRVFVVAAVYWVSLSIVRAFVLEAKVFPGLAWLPAALALIYLGWDYIGAARKQSRA